MERPEGVVVQFGGQTPLKLAAGLHAAGIKILGTSIESIDLAEDRSRFGELLGRLGYRAPPFATARAPRRRSSAAPGVGFPLLVRPSYVLGGRAMEIVYSVAGLQEYLDRVGPSPAATIYLDRFLEDSIELDVDALCDGTTSGSPRSCSTSRRPGFIPATRPACCRRTRSASRCWRRSARRPRGSRKALGVVGLLNVQFAIHGDERLHVIEANPRASRTVPFVSKAIGMPVAKLACRIMLGERIADLDLPADTSNGHVCVKEVVLPFDRFAGADSLLGPEMRSTGEVMGIARDFPTAFAKAQAAAGAQLPSAGTAFITVADGDKPAATGSRRSLHDLGFEIIATRGTAQAIRRMGIPAEPINKIGEGSPHVVDWIERGEVDLVDQHAGRHRRAHRRLRDPHGGGRARDPVHHDDGRRDGGGPRDRGRPPRRARRDLAPGAPRQAAQRGRVSERSRLRSAAARGPVTAREEYGAYVVIRCADPDGPRPQAGTVLHADRCQSVGRGGGRAAVPPAGFQRLAGPGRHATSSSSCSRTSGPGPTVCASSGPVTIC